MIKVRVPALLLLPGDQVGSGEIVLGVSRGAWTPRGKVEVILEKGDHCRSATWGAHTIINATREAFQ